MSTSKLFLYFQFGKTGFGFFSLIIHFYFCYNFLITKFPITSIWIQFNIRLFQLHRLIQPCALLVLLFSVLEIHCLVKPVYLLILAKAQIYSSSIYAAMSHKVGKQRYIIIVF